MINSSYLSLVKQRYEMYLLLKFMPGYTEVGTVGYNSTCHGVVMCSHHVCETRQLYHPSPNDTDCSLDETGLIYRSGTLSISEDMAQASVITLALSCILVSILIIICYERRNSGKNSISLVCTFSVIMLISDVAPKIYTISAINNVDAIYPNIPEYMSVNDYNRAIVMYTIYSLQTIIGLIFCIITCAHLTGNDIIIFRPLDEIDESDDDTINFRKDDGRKIWDESDTPYTIEDSGGKIWDENDSLI